MTDNMDLEALEKRAWTSMFQDGLWEIIIGLMLLTMTLGITMDELGASDTMRQVITIPMFFLGVPILYLGKKYMTIPRLGIVKFSDYREKRKLRMLQIMLAGFISTLMIWGAMSLMDVPSALLGTVLVSTLIFVTFLTLANYFQYRRFYLIAALVAVGEPIIYSLREYTEVAHVGLIAFGIPAMICIIMGIAAMGQFRRRYPRMSEDVPNAA